MRPKDAVPTRPVLPPGIVSGSTRKMQSRVGADAPGSRGYARSSRQSQSQKALRVAMRDPLFVGRAHRELVQEGARLHHRAIGLVGGEHDPFDTDLRQQAKERW